MYSTSTQVRPEHVCFPDVDVRQHVHRRCLRLASRPGPARIFRAWPGPRGAGVAAQAKKCWRSSDETIARSERRAPHRTGGDIITPRRQEMRRGQQLRARDEKPARAKPSARAATGLDCRLNNIIKDTPRSVGRDLANPSSFSRVPVTSTSSFVERSRERLL